MHITNDGLIALQRPNKTVLNIYYNHLDTVISDFESIRKISDSIHYKIIQKDHINRVEICGAKIAYSSEDGLDDIAAKIRKNLDGYSFYRYIPRFK